MTELVIISEESISGFVRECAELHLRADHGTWAQFLSSKKFALDRLPPEDPESPEFRQFQLDLWRRVSGREDYTPDVSELNNNLPNIDGITKFYPFTSGSAQETGNYMLAAASILKKVALPPGSKVVEFGIGFGHTTRLMSSYGLDVTAVDIEKRFLDMLAPYSLPGARPITTVHSSFENATFAPASVDAFVFFECFHHCLAFADLLRNMKLALKPGGKIVFCAEAFYDDWFDFPWGLRLDGHSVWAIRNFGWMELGFRKSFISSLLHRNGFTTEWSSLPEAGSYGEFLTAVASET